MLPLRFELPAGLATVLGALPQLVLDRLPRLPSAELVVDLSSDEARSTLGLDDVALEPVAAFFESVRGRVEPIVLSLAGPVTQGLALMDAGMDRPEALGFARTAVEHRGRRLLDLAARALPAAPVLLFLSEPGLANSMHPSFPLEPGEIEGLVTDVVAPLSERAMVGVTVEGRADWSMLLGTGISLLGAPVTAHLESAAAELARFLEGGGFIAWGAVPTDEPLGASAERLWRRLSALWGELVSVGLDPLLLRDRSIITASSGLAGFGVSQAERVIGLAQDLADRVLTQTVGARLSIGA